MVIVYLAIVITIGIFLTFGLAKASGKGSRAEEEQYINENN